MQCKNTLRSESKLLPFGNTQISNYTPYMLNIMLLAVNLDLELCWIYMHTCKMRLGE